MSEDIKIFRSLSQEQIFNNPLLLEILDLNGEQLTYYLEEKFIDNPFVEFEYPIEKRFSKVPQHIKGVEDPEIDIQSPSAPQTLDTFLFEQIMLHRQTPIRDVMGQIVPLLDERGYLPLKYTELANKLDVDPIVALDAMTLFHQLEPTGIGAYDLKECLMLQIEQDPNAPNQAYELLKNYYPELIEEDYSEIAQQTNLNLDYIKRVVNYYHTLRARPASLFERLERINLIPDVEVQFFGKTIQINVNRQYYPRLIFNQEYYQEMKNQDNPNLMAYIIPHRELFEEMLECLRLREQLLVMVTKLIVKAQSSYIKGDTDSPTPLLVKDLAEKLRLSDSLVSHIIVNKNLAYGEKVSPLSDFINVSAKVGRSGLSALNIQNRIKELLREFGQNLSSQEVVEILAEQKIIISSRLVERYRQNIANSQLEK